MSETKYTGGCHCGNVRFEVTTDLSRVLACNCSICSKRGHLFTFVDENRFTLLSGADRVTDYQFNKKAIHLLFCATCGVGSYATGSGRDGKTMFAVNARCLDGVDPATLSLTPFDGKSL